jgi:uncharacterized NAD(P)/FAD-binding protein YdhS
VRILADVAEAENAVARVGSGVRGTLRVSVPVLFGEHHVAPLIPQLLARHEELRVELSLDDRFVNLTEERLDAAGHRGRIVALSRRGLIPRSHADFDPAPVELDDVPAGNVRALWRWLRRRSAEVGWRAAVDSLRPHSHPLWQSLTADQQHRFLRHARPWWDVHRHRIAPEVGATIARLVGEGRLEIVAGRIVAARETGGGIEVEYRRRRSTALQPETFAYAFNCTGPLHSVERTRDPLLRSLLDAGKVRPDHLGIGLEVDGPCRAGEHLWAMGPLTKGRYWEIIAVPDIREQAAEVAADIERELGA